ncbi:MAG: hypothetical protein MR371_02485, partial [Clostridia bacterium]|nr:hypothetical protein [Clostridia bacterium]
VLSFGKLTQKERRKTDALCRLSKNSGEFERAAALSNFQSSPAACTVGAGLFYRMEIPFPGEKIATLQILRPESERLKQNLEGVVVAGELAPSSTSLSKLF